MQLAAAGLRVVCIEPEEATRQAVGESLDWSVPDLLSALGLPMEDLVKAGIATWKRHVTMCIVAMCLGLRVSEVLGFKWTGIDWDGLRIAIRQAYVYGRQGDVKTRASQKWMPLDPSLAEKLRQHRFRLSSRPNIENWVFANPETGKPYWPGRVQENWLVPAAKKLEIGRIGWHTFRHSHSTLLHALGVDLKVQQELLRHADVRTTLNIYTQAVPSALREANSKVVRLVIPAQVA
jgi:integrase